MKANFQQISRTYFNKIPARSLLYASDPVYQVNVGSIREKLTSASLYDWMSSIINLLHKNFNEEQLNSSGFPVFP